MDGEEQLKQINATAAAFSLLGMIMWLARWFRPDGQLSREQVAEEICKFALGGLLHQELLQQKPAVKLESKTLAKPLSKTSINRNGARR